MPSKSICIVTEGDGVNFGEKHDISKSWLFLVPHKSFVFCPHAQTQQHWRVSGFIFEGILVEGLETTQQTYLITPTTGVCAAFLIYKVCITESPGACCSIINVIGNLVLEHSQDFHHTQASLSNHWTFHSSLSHPPYLSLLPSSSEAPFKPYWHDY